MVDSRKTTRVAVRCLSAQTARDSGESAGSRLLAYACAAALIAAVGLHFRPLVAAFMTLLGR
jgi:hypothetical protein